MKGLFSAFSLALDKSVTSAIEGLPYVKWEQVFGCLLKCLESLRIKIDGEEMRIYHYGEKQLLICLNCVCFPAISTKVCHENEHLPVFSEAASSQEVYLMTFGETCFSLLTRNNMPIKDGCAGKAPLFSTLPCLKLRPQLMLCGWICSKRQMY